VATAAVRAGGIANRRRGFVERDAVTLPLDDAFYFELPM